MCRETLRAGEGDDGAGCKESGGALLQDLILQVRHQTFGSFPGLPESQLSRGQRILINRWLEGHLRVRHVRRFVRYPHVRSINRNSTRDTTGCQDWRNDYWLCDDRPMNVPAPPVPSEDPAAAVYDGLGEFMAARHATASYF